MQEGFSATYLYKLHRLTNSVDSLFDFILKKYLGLGLSQFLLLLAAAEQPGASQQQLAAYLGFSRAAVSRQVRIAMASGWLSLADDSQDGRRQITAVTPRGQSVLQSGLAALEQHAFKIFAQENQQTGLMQHLDMLLTNIKEAKESSQHVVIRKNKEKE